MRYLRSGLASSSSQLQICVRLVKVKLSEACDPILGSAWPPAPISADTSHSTLLRWLQAPNILDLDFEKALSGNVLVFCQSKNLYLSKIFLARHRKLKNISPNILICKGVSIREHNKNINKTIFFHFQTYNCSLSSTFVFHNCCSCSDRTAVDKLKILELALSPGARAALSSVNLKKKQILKTKHGTVST